jgi:uncharacterized membrane protein YgaE (UPF0421/DUF939 family)
VKTLEPATLKKNISHPAKMATAAVLAFLAAQGLGLSAAFWAAISALVVVQAEANALLAVSWLLLLGTALGVCAGALLANTIGSNVVGLAVGLLGVGLLSAALRLERRANHFAAVALIVVLLAGPASLAWSRAWQRFIEFSLGIIVALLLNAVWPEANAGPARIPGKATTLK